MEADKKTHKIFESADYICITLVYFLSQFMLLIITGRWADDWNYYPHDVEFLHEVMRQSGIPLEAYILRSVWWIPKDGYRIIVFLLYLVGTYFLYKTLINLNLFSKQACLWICMLYEIIPINDIRVTLICFGYALGLCSFWISFYLVTLWQRKIGKQRILVRGISLIILMFSFNLASLMAMDGLIILYLYYTDFLKMSEGKVLKNLKYKLPKIILKNIDYLLAPIIFYFGKQLLFPPYGEFAGYNVVSVDNLRSAVLKFPFAVCESLRYMVEGVWRGIGLWGIGVCGIFALFTFMLSLKGLKYKLEDVRYINSIKLFIVGCLCFLVGIFPYIIVRNGGVATTGLRGRDSMLLGLGMATMIYYGFQLLFLPRVRYLCYIFVIYIGIFHFNAWYLMYQEDWYRQLQTIYEIRENQEIQDASTILYLTNYGSPVETTYCYTLNGLSYVATGKMDKFILSEISNLQYLDNLDSIIARKLQDYDKESRILDGVLFVNDKPMGKSDVLSLKWNEMFNKIRFQQRIVESKDMQYISLTEEQSNRIMDMYYSGKLTKDYLKYYLGYE